MARHDFLDSADIRSSDDTGYMFSRAVNSYEEFYCDSLIVAEAGCPMLSTHPAKRLSSTLSPTLASLFEAGQLKLEDIAFLDQWDLDDVELPPPPPKPPVKKIVPPRAVGCRGWVFRAWHGPRCGSA